MKYKIQHTLEAEEDLFQLAYYMIKEFQNSGAAEYFLNCYYQKAESLETFPFGYRGVSFEYRGYEIRLKPYDTYNIFFVVDTETQTVTILRVLKDRQDWAAILFEDDEYHFK
ncbi:type II toxin-antitoxin system RelE/ParE family toxin [Muricomes intestini]|jgi:plasmid stabilization system protein ParE|uniref:Plasmid stabilization system protein ParE n=1 Tax=Muricomes intestini TaxID=1796634 RepID=A0A4R3JZX2_9FIRM|nr:type II toxin-antitoxin system RelE/ParE family toxin [Muricomes intestini]TCS74702.1 plasmid stabilization system protein ParE [Muricomes intestini]HAX51398.1 plasmid stabilization system protein [Lachnospiraceae bacterium]HCR82365.1 plasmid stabilization system protein [Lachnospiraceae bacterium]